MFSQISIATLSGSAGKVVASHVKISGSSPGLTERDLYVLCTSCAHGVLPCKGRGVTASQLDLPVSDAIIRSWLWSTATGSCPLGYLGNITTSS